MKKSNLIILCISILLTIFASYLIFVSGITKKLIANVNDVLQVNKEGKLTSDLPIINMVLNSSGEKLVNTDVAIIVKATSNYNIKKLEYSYDLKNWITFNKEFNSKEITAKLVFKKTINSDLYIRVLNDRGYRSYSYKTKINIDKKRPYLNIKKDGNDIIIKSNDNDSIKYIQYSNDGINWDSEEISGNSITLTKNIYDMTYVRAVDMAGNISEVKKVD